MTHKKPYLPPYAEFSFIEEDERLLENTWQTTGEPEDWKQEGEFGDEAKASFVFGAEDGGIFYNED